MSDTFKALVFEPNKEGIIVDISPEDFKEIIGGFYQLTANKHGFNDTVVIVNEEGAIHNLPYNRGYYGTFIVTKEQEYNDDFDEEDSGYVSLTEGEITKVKQKIDHKSNFASRSEYLNTFFEEKELPIILFDYHIGNVFVTITNYDAIEAILNSSDDVLQQSENIIRNIDLMNGDVNHFLQHIGHEMAANMVENI